MSSTNHAFSSIPYLCITILFCHCFFQYLCSRMNSILFCKSRLLCHADSVICCMMSCQVHRRWCFYFLFVLSLAFYYSRILLYFTPLLTLPLYFSYFRSQSFHLYINSYVYSKIWHEHSVYLPSLLIASRVYTLSSNK